MAESIHLLLVSCGLAVLGAKLQRPSGHPIVIEGVYDNGVRFLFGADSALAPMVVAAVRLIRDVSVSTARVLDAKVGGAWLRIIAIDRVPSTTALIALVIFSTSITIVARI